MRCAGYLSHDGKHAFCTREELAGKLDPHETSTPLTYKHKLGGTCECGARHDPVDLTAWQSYDGFGVHADTNSDGARRLHVVKSAAASASAAERRERGLTPAAERSALHVMGLEVCVTQTNRCNTFYCPACQQ